MFYNRAQQHPRPSSPLKTLIGVIGIIIGIVFFLQAAGVFTFNITDPLYLRIFAVYAIISGLILVVNIQRHAIIRY